MDTFILDVSVPANTSAEIVLPDLISGVTAACGLAFEKADDVYRADAEAGDYHIVCSM